MSQTEDEELQRISEWLLDGRRPIPKQTAPTRPKSRSSRPPRRRDRATDEVEADLAALGFNRRERERVRRRQSRPPRKPRDAEHAKAIAIKRFEFYLKQRVDWSATHLNFSEVVAAWALLADHDIDKALKWWDQGVDPLDIIEIQQLTANGFALADLYAVRQGKTIAQHLREGTSLKWCLLALGWKNKT